MSNSFLSLENPLFEEEFDVVLADGGASDIIPTLIASPLSRGHSDSPQAVSNVQLALNAQQLALISIKERAVKIQQGNKEVLFVSLAPTFSPRSLALVVSNLEGQFTEVSRKKRKIVENSSGPLGDRGRRNIPDCFNKFCKSFKTPPK